MAKGIDFNTIKSYLTGLSKTTLVNIVLILPVVFYFGSSLYIAEKARDTKVNSIHNKVEKILETLDEVKGNQDQLSESIVKFYNNLDDKIVTSNANTIKEVKGQLSYMVQFSKQDKEALKQHLDYWEETYLRSIQKTVIETRNIVPLMGRKSVINVIKKENNEIEN